jgi:hypothetical protein
MNSASNATRARPGAGSRAWVREAMRAWRDRFGAPPSSTDWSRSHARSRGGRALERLRAADRPSSSTVIDLTGPGRPREPTLSPTNDAIDRETSAVAPGTYPARCQSSPPTRMVSASAQ